MAEQSNLPDIAYEWFDDIYSSSDGVDSTESESDIEMSTNREPPRSDFSAVLGFRVGPEPNPLQSDEHEGLVSTLYEPNSNTFILHTAFVRNYCERINNQLFKAERSFRPIVGQIVDLPDYDAKVVNVFAKWLYTGEVGLTWHLAHERMILVDAYALGCELEATAFRNKICELVAESCTSTVALPGYELITRAWDIEASWHHKLRELFLDLWLYHWKGEGTPQPLFDGPVYPQTFSDYLFAKKVEQEKECVQPVRPETNTFLYLDLPAPDPPFPIARKGPSLFPATLNKMIGVGVTGCQDLVYIHSDFFAKDSRIYKYHQQGCMLPAGFEGGRWLLADWLYKGRAELHDTHTLQALLTAWILGQDFALPDFCNDVADAIIAYLTLYAYPITNREVRQVYHYTEAHLPSPFRRLVVDWWVRHVPTPAQPGGPPNPDWPRTRSPAFLPAFAADVLRERAERAGAAAEDAKRTAAADATRMSTARPSIAAARLANSRADTELTFHDEAGKNPTPYLGDRLDRYHTHYPQPGCTSEFLVKCWAGKGLAAVDVLQGRLGESEGARFGRIRRLPWGWRTRVEPGGRRYWIDEKGAVRLLDPRALVGGVRAAPAGG